MKYLKCETCGNIMEVINESGIPVICCGQKMTELIPGLSDGAQEKHVPVAVVNEDEVVVMIGAVEHPMLEEHYIEWIAIETTNGSQRRKLDYTDKPRAEFKLAKGEELVAVYEYCNIHGLWKA